MPANEEFKKLFEIVYCWISEKKLKGLHHIGARKNRFFIKYKFIKFIYLLNNFYLEFMNNFKYSIIS